jgi:DNA-binding NarL/FixJ family response regulator
VTIRVLVADDHPMFRFGLIAALSAMEDIAVVGEAGSGDELLALAARERPDVVITDLAMPNLDGAAATARLLAGQPRLAVLILTMHDDDESLVAALQAGARGYLVKGAGLAEIARAVRSVAHGEAVYSAVVGSRIARLATDGPRPALPQLTPRERDVLDLLAAGRRNHDIAARLGMSEKTVRNHVSAVLMKLQVEDRTAAALRAREAGLGRGRAGG